MPVGIDGYHKVIQFQAAAKLARPHLHIGSTGTQTPTIVEENVNNGSELKSVLVRLPIHIVSIQKGGSIANIGCEFDVAAFTDLSQGYTANRD